MSTTKFLSILISTLALLAFSLGGCKNKGEGPGANAGKEEPSLAVEDPVWIKVNDREVHKSEVEKEIEAIKKSFNGPVPPELEDTIKRYAMQWAARRALLEDLVEKEGIEVSDLELEDAVAREKSRYPDPEMFVQVLKSQGLSEEDFKEEVKQNLRFQKFFEKHVEIPEPSKKDVEDFYEKIKDQLKKAPEVTVIHILFRPSNPSEEEKSKKKKLAEEVRKQLLSGGDIEALAMQYSDSPSRAKGGKEHFTKGEMGEDFDSVVFNLKEGELSPVFETSLGYHLVKVVEKKPERPTPLWEIDDKIKAYLKGEKQKELYPAYMEELMKKARIEYLEPLPPEQLPSSTVGPQPGASPETATPAPAPGTTSEPAATP